MRSTWILCLSVSALAVTACLGGREGFPDDHVGGGGEGGALGLGDGGGPSEGSSPGGHPVCGTGWIDFGCDATVDALMEGCPPGHRIGLVAGEPCASCVPDEPPADGCSEGRARYLELLTQVAEASCADYCDSTADCALITIDNALMSGCSFGLYVWIDEEIIVLADALAAESSADCDGPVPSCPAVATGSDVVCVDRRCVLVP